MTPIHTSMRETLAGPRNNPHHSEHMTAKAPTRYLSVLLFVDFGPWAELCAQDSDFAVPARSFATKSIPAVPSRSGGARARPQESTLQQNSAQEVSSRGKHAVPTNIPHDLGLANPHLLCGRLTEPPAKMSIIGTVHGLPEDSPTKKSLGRERSKPRIWTRLHFSGPGFGFGANVRRSGAIRRIFMGHRPQQSQKSISRKLA